MTIITHIYGGFALSQRWPWSVLIILGYGLSGLSITSVPVIAVAYAIDCFKPISDEIMVMAAVLKDLLGSYLSYWIFDLAEAAERGWVTVFLVQFAVTIAPVILTVPLWVWGKGIRRWYRGSELHRMEEMI